MRALVLSGGGDKGAYQAGAIQCLLGDLNTHYDILTGVSVGALNVGFLAMFKQGEEKVASDQLVDLWRGMRRRNVWCHWWLPYVAGIWKPGLYNSKPLQKLVLSTINMNRIRQAGKKVRVGAVSYNSDQVRAFREDDAKFPLGIVGSSAFPAFLTAVKIDDEWYYDEGVVDMTPLEQAIELGAEEIDAIVLSAGKQKLNKGKPNSVDLARRAIARLISTVVEDDLKKADLYNRLLQAGTECGGKRPIKIRILRPKTPLEGNPLDFNPSVISQRIDLGYRDARRRFSDVS